MSHQPDTNPHFLSEEQPQRRRQPSQPYGPQLPPSREQPQPQPRRGQPSQPHGPRRQPSPEEREQPSPHRPQPSPQPHGRRVQFPEEQLPHRGQPSQQSGLGPPASPTGQSRRGPPSQPRIPQRQPPLEGPEQPRQDLRMPPPRRTKPITWFIAVFCAVFWVVVILGGLIVLIVYLVFRPRSPRFEVSSATLNAAYLDMGYLLNADLSLLAKFTNPNQKVSVDFSYMVINLYYDNTLIATRSIYPFSAGSTQSILADVHMVTSQVPLPLKETLKLARQMQNNRVQFEVQGVFRARSNLGSFLRYSYWLYGHCTIVVAHPPNGVLLSSRCRTKR